MSVAVSNINTLSKLGAHLRWALEREGIKAEEALVTIGVKDEIERSLMISAFLRDFDSAVMRRHDSVPECLVLHGVPVIVAVQRDKGHA